MIRLVTITYAHLHILNELFKLIFSILNILLTSINNITECFHNDSLIFFIQHDIIFACLDNSFPPFQNVKQAQQNCCAFENFSENANGIKILIHQYNWWISLYTVLECIENKLVNFFFLVSHECYLSNLASFTNGIKVHKATHFVSRSFKSKGSVNLANIRRNSSIGSLHLNSLNNQASYFKIFVIQHLNSTTLIFYIL